MRLFRNKKDKTSNLHLTKVENSHGSSNYVFICKPGQPHSLLRHYQCAVHAHTERRTNNPIYLSKVTSSSILLVLMDASRISLRSFKLSDVDDLLKWVSDDRVANNVRWCAITSKEEALAHLQNVAIPHPWHHSICLDNRSIGYIAVWFWQEYGVRRAEIGYALGVDYWGQGIATTALKMALSRVFKEVPDLVRLEAFTLVDNHRSQRLLERVGFLREGLLRKVYKYKGELRDFYNFSFLSTDKIL